MGTRGASLRSGKTINLEEGPKHGLGNCIKALGSGGSGWPRVRDNKQVRTHLLIDVAYA